MNHIYKTIWNATLGAWTVTQETAKARGKSSGGSGSGARVRFAYTAVASALLLASGQAMAVTGTEYQIFSDNICFYDTTTQSVICGDATTSVVDTVDGKTAKSVAVGLKAKTAGESNVALGANSSASHTSGLAIGANAKAHHNQTVAVGERASATGEADVAIGKAAAENAVSTGRNVAIGENALSSATRANNVIAIGTNASSGSDSTHTVAIGTNANSTEGGKLAIKSSNNVAVGYNSRAGNNNATDGGAVAIGYTTTASMLQSTALGSAANAGGQYSLAAGANASVTENSNYAIAIGGGNTSATAATASNAFATAVGYNAKSVGRHATALGSTTSAAGLGSAALGSGATTTNTGAISISATTDNGATQRTTASGSSSIAMGVSTTAQGANSIAVGNRSNAYDLSTVSVGNQSGSAGVDYAGRASASRDPRTQAGRTHNEGLLEMTNIGNKAGENTINNQQSVNIGSSAGTGNNSAWGGGVSVGHQSGAVDRTTSAAVATEMLNFSATSRGAQSGVIVTGNNNTAVGSKSGKNALGHDNVALGADAGGYSSGNSNISIGHNAGRVTNATGPGEPGTEPDHTQFGSAHRTVSIGEGAYASKDDAIAIGSRNLASGISAIAIGTRNQVSGNYSGALGDPSIVNGTASYTFGNDNAVGSTSSNAFVLGNNNQVGATATYDAAGKLQLASGLTNTAAVNGAASVGNRNYINTSGTYVLGSGINTTGTGSSLAPLGSTVANSVYLGDDSTVTAAAGKNALKDSAADGDTTTGGATGTVASATVGGTGGTTYSGFAGQTAVGAVSVGAAGAERRIQNVAAGEVSATSTDAINGSQLYSVANTLQTQISNINGVEYYSVNPGVALTAPNPDTTNKTNTGARGQRAVAAGIDVTASGTDSVAVGSTLTASGAQSLAAGNNVTASGLGATALGNNTFAGADHTLAVGQSSRAIASEAVAVGRTAIASGANAAAFGSHNTASGTSSFAGGHGSTASGVRAIALGAQTKATGSDNIAIGYQAEADGNTSLAVGPYASADGGGMAIGASSQSQNGGMAIGSGANSGNGTALIPGLPVRLNNNVALGDSALVKDDTNFNVALGSMSIAGDANLAADPYKPTATSTVAGIAGTGVTLGEVSVGGDNTTIHPGGEMVYRRITNVGAGSADTDAVNVSQLKAVANAAAAQTATTPLVVADGTTPAGVPAGQVVAPTGTDADKLATAGDIAKAINNSGFNLTAQGANGSLVNAGETVDLKNTDNNIKISKAATDNTVTFNLADSINLAGSVTAGGTRIGPNGLTFVDNAGTPIANSPSITSGGINAGNQPITNVASGGTTPTNAANIDDVQKAAAAAKTVVAGGTNIASVTPTSVAGGPTTYTINADGAKVSAGSTAMSVTPGAKDANNVIDYAVDLSADSKASLAKANTALQTVTSTNPNLTASTSGTTVTLGFVDAPTFAGTVTAPTFVASGSKPVTINGTAGTITGLSNTTFASGTTYTGGQAATQEQLTSLYSQVNTNVNAAKTEVVAGSNIEVTPSTGANGQSVYTVRTSATPTFTSVTAGGNVLNGTALTVNNNTVTSVNDAINQTAEQAFNPLTFAGDSGTNVTRKLGDTLNIKGGATTLTDNNIGVVADAATNTLTVKLAKDIDLGTTGSVKTGNTTVNNAGVTIANADPNKTVSLSGSGLNNGGNQITNVASGGTTPTNAANIDDVQKAAAAAKTVVAGGTNIASVTPTSVAGGPTTYTINADGAKVSAGSTAMSVTPGAKDANNVIDYAVDLSADSKASLAKANTALQTVTSTNPNLTASTSGTTVTLGFVDAPTFAGTVTAPTFVASGSKPVTINGTAGTITGLSNTTFASGTTYTGGQAATQEQLTSLYSQVNTNVNAAKTEVVAGSNIEVTPSTGANGQSVYTVRTSATPTFTSVTAGGNVLNGTALTVNNNTVTSVNDAINQTAEQAFNPLTFAGDSGTNVTRKLGDTLNIKGGATTLTDNNIGVVADAATNTLTVKLAKDIDLGTTGSVKTGNTTVNNAGVTIANADPNKTVSLSGSGLNNGGNQITNVASGGTTPTNAANIDDVQKAAAAAKTVVAGGTNIASVTPTSVAGGPTTYTINADGAKVSAGSTAMSVTPGAKDANNVIDYAVDLSADSKASLAKANTALQTVTSTNPNLTASTSGTTVTLGFVDAPTFAGTVTAPTFVASGSKPVTINGTAGTITGLSNTTFASGTTYTGGQAATQEQLTSLYSQVNTNVNAAKTEVVAGSNIEVTPSTGANGQSVYTVRTSATPTFTSVTAGGNVLNGTALTVNNNTVTSVNDAINQTAEQAFNPLTFAGDSGTNVTRKLGDTLNIKGGATTLTDNNIGVVADAATNTLTVKLAKDIDLGTTGSVKTGNTTVNNAGVTIANADPNKTVSLSGSGLNNGGNQITNVASGGTTPTNAANIDDVQKAAAAAKTVVAGGTNIASVTPTSVAGGPTTYTINADGAKVSAGSTAMSVTPGAKDANNVIDYAVDLSADSKASLAKANTALQTVTSTNPNLTASTSGTTVTLGFVDAPTFAGTVTAPTFVASGSKPVTINGTAGTITGLSNTTFASGTTYTGGQAATQEQLTSLYSQVNTNVNAAKTEVVAGSNIEVTPSTGANGQSVYTVRTSATPTFTSVTAGGNVLNGTALTVNNNTVTSVNDAINQTAEQAFNPLTFAGDSGTNVTRKLGDTLNIKGGATTLTDNNIGVVADAATNTLTVKLAKDIDLGTTGSVKTGNTTVNNAGVTIANADPNKTVSLSGSGLNNGGNQITNVASGGTDATNAANIGDVQRAAAAAANTVSAGSSNVSVAPTTNANGSTNYAVSVAPAALQYTNTNTPAGGNTPNTDQFTQTNQVTLVGAGNNTSNGVTINNVAKADLSTNSKQAVNGGQLRDFGDSAAAALGGTSAFDPASGKVTAGLSVGGTTHTSVQAALNAINTTAGSGWNLQANGGTASNIAPNGTVNVVNGSNTTVALSGNELKVNVVDNPTFSGTVTAGGGLTVGAGQAVNMGGNRIQNVAAGINPTDAVNKSQLEAAVQGSVINVTNQINAVDARVTNVDNRVTNVDNRVTQLGNLVGTNPTNPDGTRGTTTYDVEKQTTTTHTNLFDTVNEMNLRGIKYTHTKDNGEAPVLANAETNDSSAGADGSTAHGVNAIVDPGATNGTAMGRRARVRALHGVAIGNETEAGGESALAIGDGARALGKRSISIGTGNIVYGEGSGAMGDPTIINADNSYSIGNNNRIEAGSHDAFVLGNEVTATAANSVNLGSRSAAQTAVTPQTAGMADYSAANIDGVTYHYAGGTPAGVVSVGDVGEERRIQNVAAGQVSPTSTDAINGSQLYQTTAAINAVANRINVNHDKAMGGIASAMATAGLPQAYMPGKSMVAMGAATYQGRSAVAVGVSTISDNGHWVIKGSFNTNSHGHVGASVGAGYQW